MDALSIPEKKSLSAHVEAWFEDMLWERNYDLHPDDYAKIDPQAVLSLIRRGLLWDAPLPPTLPCRWYRLSVLAVRAAPNGNWPRERRIASRILEALRGLHGKPRTAAFGAARRDEEIAASTGLALPEVWRGLKYCQDLYEPVPFSQEGAVISSTVSGLPHYTCIRDFQVENNILWIPRDEEAVDTQADALQKTRLEAVRESLPPRILVGPSWKALRVAGMRGEPIRCGEALHQALKALHVQRLKDQGVKGEADIGWVAFYQKGKKQSPARHVALSRLWDALAEANVPPARILERKPGEGWRLRHPLSLPPDTKL